MMKRLFIIVFLLLVGMAGYASTGESFAIRRGINLSHWLSQRIENGPAIKDGMREIDFRKISQDGFDHVRLPIDEEVMWNERGRRMPKLSIVCIKVFAGPCRMICGLL